MIKVNIWYLSVKILRHSGQGYPKFTVQFGRKKLLVCDSQKQHKQQPTNCHRF